MIQNNDTIINNKNKGTLHLNKKLTFMFRFESLKDLEYENLELSTFINDCNYDTQRCNLTVYQNSILNNSFSEPIIFGKYTFLKEFINVKKPIYFFGLDKEGFEEILDGSDVMVPNQKGYQIACLSLSAFNREYAGYDFFEIYSTTTPGPYFYHCRKSSLRRNSVANCLAIGDNNEFYVISHYHGSMDAIVSNFSQIYENYTIETNKTLISNTFTAKDIFSSFYYYYTSDINNQVYVGLIFSYISNGSTSNSTCLVKLINEPLLNYSNIIGIVGNNDSILICGNHQSNNSLIVYSYSFTSEKQSFVYSDKVYITHVIQPQFSSSRYCLFFSDKTNSSILFDIDQNKVIINHNHLNLNISGHLNENSTRSISYFMNPKEFTKDIINYSEPLEKDIPPNNYDSNENNSPTLIVSFSTLTISLLLLSFINIL
ncbi:hypothetical protein ACTFIY_008544 [Dictyostelium cf. discoideum]